MASSEGSFFGLAEQVAKGTPNVTDAEFDFLLLLRDALGVNNVNLPLDREVGGGALTRNVVKAGVTSGGALRFIPRPVTTGQFLNAYFGNSSSAVGSGTEYTHTFTFGASQFTAPYYTIRSAPGGMFGHQYPDQRLAALSFDFAARDFLRASAAFIGGTPSKVDTAAWAPTTYLDEGPQFLTALSHIEIPDATVLKVLGGSINLQNAIPLDEQWVIGSYTPDDFAINSRAISLSLRVKIADDGALYNKMSLDPAGGSTWVASLFKEGDIDISFISNVIADGTTPYSLTFHANGQAAATGDSNVVFQAAPIDIVPGRQVTMDIVGTFLADPTAGDEPVSVELVNLETSY